MVSQKIYPKRVENESDPQRFRKEDSERVQGNRVS